MRVVTLVTITLALLTVLAGCGQKGALYRDHQEIVVPAVVKPASTLSDRNEIESRKDVNR